jgi:hypothetical protein
MSSAHVYCRIPLGSGITIENLPKELLTDCAQLTKANSIEGMSFWLKHATCAGFDIDSV